MHRRRARHTPPQANLWYIADVTMTSHVWASWARRCFYPGDSILQEGVVAEVPAFLGHVRADETRTHVVHDLLEAGGRDAGRQHVQYHSTRRSYFVVYLLVLRKWADVRVIHLVFAKFSDLRNEFCALVFLSTDSVNEDVIIVKHPASI